MSGTASMVVGALEGLGGLAGAAALVKVFVDRTKIRADAIAEIADTSVGMLRPLHDEIDRLNAKLRTAETELDDLRRRMRELSTAHDELESLRDRVRVAEQARELLYEELAEKNRDLAEQKRLTAARDKTIAKLRANLPPGAPFVD